MFDKMITLCKHLFKVLLIFIFQVFFFFSILEPFFPPQVSKIILKTLAKRSGPKHCVTQGNILNERPCFVEFIRDQVGRHLGEQKFPS